MTPFDYLGPILLVLLIVVLALAAIGSIVKAVLVFAYTYGFTDILFGILWLLVAAGLGSIVLWLYRDIFSSLVVG